LTTIETFQFEPREEWQRKFKQGESDVIISLLLSLLSNLTSLNLRPRILGVDTAPVVCKSVLDALLVRSRGGGSSSKDLKSIHFHADSQAPGILPDYQDNSHVGDFANQIAPMFEMASLDLGWLPPALATSLWPASVPRTSNLTRLNLRQSYGENIYLIELLKATPRLEQLSLGIIYDQERVHTCDCSKLGSALEQVSTAFTSLDICLSY
jgi:hypothetical protein